MLRATAFPAPNNSVAVLSGNNTCPYLETTRVIYPRSSFISRFNLLHFRQLHVKCPRAVRGGGGFVPVAKKRGSGSVNLVEIEGDFNDETDEDVSYEYDEEDEEEVADDEDEDEDEEEIVSSDVRRKWFENKPKGFGEGKVYDTKIEDKLFEELQQSKRAQAANLKRLKTNPIKTASKNDAQNKIDEKVVPILSRVRLVNLPKKRKIDRDLKSAFQGIRGITQIVPAVIGNKKTRDPICKGFAFVDFTHEEDAVRFVELYTGKTITFGKIQKQIKCEFVNEQSSSSSLELRKNHKTALPLLPSFEEDSNEDSNMDDSALGTWEETDLELDNADEQRESDGEKKAPVKVGKKNAPKKKPSTKENAKKVLDVSGSAKRLKIKEKASLSDVFSKYGSKTALASKDN
ncbi:stress response protein NST1 isoform X2 [Vicia villosa]|uniref:stress response protein NST1 isoform X2 n=1 Tax=Vicia villosa TaxID=3911 RepID=UPI00273C11E8|nr:stress response protein NST1 isoform X2 [Vicia villosa]